MRPIVIFATLLAIACDTPPVEGPPGPAGPAGPQGAVGPAGPPGGSTVKSGTRLKARVARSEDGASQFLGWWDSELGVECTRDSPGTGLVSRCLPVAPLPVWSGSKFADSDCSLPAVRLDTPTPYCSTLLGSDGTGDRLRTYYPVGAAADRVFGLVDGSCVEMSATVDAEWKACGDLPEVPLESFAAMPEMLED